MTEISKNILLVSGSGRNVGKTTFISEVIARNANQNIVAIKITPHFHEFTDGLVPIVINENYTICQETEGNTKKDSSLFLKAGAGKVFYIQTKDHFLKEAFLKVAIDINNDQPVIVESAALRKFIIPGLYLYIQKSDEEIKQSAIEMKKVADQVVISNGKEFSINPESIVFNLNWKIK